MEHMSICLLITTVLCVVHCKTYADGNAINEYKEIPKIFGVILQRIEDKLGNLVKRVETLEGHHLAKVHNKNVLQDVDGHDNLNDTSDLEDRVHDLELGLAAVADDLDELEESQNTQDERFLAIEADINQLDDAYFTLDTRVDSLSGTSALHSEQISVMEHSISLLEDKVDVLENTDTETLESISNLENTDIELDQRLDQVETLLNNTSDGILEERVDALEEVDENLNARIDGIEAEIGPGEGSANDSLAVCYGGYITLSDDYRRVGETGTNCDRDVIEDGRWYRFDVSTGENGLLDRCPAGESCGTHAAFWMTTAHPKVIGQRMQSFVVASYLGECDWSSYHEEIEVTKCYVGGERFYLYKLWKPTGCSLAYCVRRYDEI